MMLRQLFGAGAPDVPVSGLAYSNDHVKPGDVFFCVPGFRADGHDFAHEAVRRGACAIVCQHKLNLGVPEFVVSDVRAEMGRMAAEFFDHPSAKMTVVGVTGTNGKTTTAFLVRTLLERAGMQTGLLGSVNTIIGGQVQPAERTTPESIVIQNALSKMVAAGDRACVMEVSSHGLALKRTTGIQFDTRIFTNLSRDHLDFHLTMDNYFAAKRQLFQGSGSSVVCIDDSYGAKLAAELEAPVTCGLNPAANFSARDIVFDRTGASFTCDTEAESFDVKIPLPGSFNVQNALAAICAAQSLGVPQQTVAASLAEANPVPGRFQAIDEGQSFYVLVDFAHSPGALANALQAARSLDTGRLHVVFGAEGNSDTGKRPLMGQIASRYADRVIITSDDPRSEDPEEIIDQIADGAPSADREPDRRSAIECALSEAKPNDIVVVAGRGHERYQLFEGNRREPFYDAQVVKELLRAEVPTPR
jgi:UDP-N-acetylmuramoyl-L-alanyl-D-glutamate--2,6-diaminopimelate ligase